MHVLAHCLKNGKGEKGVLFVVDGTDDMGMGSGVLGVGVEVV
jgi:hypothetical protein